MDKKIKFPQKHAAKQQKILKATRKLLAQKGAQKLSAAAIAHELGWTTPGLYYYYPNLQTIIDEVLKQLIQESFDATWEAAKLGTNGLQGLIFAFEARIQHYLNHPEDFDLTWNQFADQEVSQELLTEFLYPKAQAFSQWLAQWLEEEKTTGRVGQKVDCRKLVNLMIALVQGILSFYLTFDRVGGQMRYSVDEMIAEGRRTLLAALKD